jgi:hypothetical protein
MKAGATRSIRSLLSSTAVLTAAAILYFLLDRYDWDQAFVRFVCLASLLAVCLLARGPPIAHSSDVAVRIEFILAVGLTLFLVERALYLGWDEIGLPPRVDVGVTTRDAARMLLLDGKNPYRSETIAVLGDDPRYWGYKYGPAMIFGYSICAVFGESGVKIANLGYLVLTLLAVFLLARNQDHPRGGYTTAWFCCALTLLPNRIWYELLYQGVIDIFPITLILFSLLSIGRKAWFVAGLLAGLSFSSKFSPGVFYLALFLRHERVPRFLAGLACGLLPLGAFLAWDSGALLRNFLVFHLIKGYDSTSLYSIMPRELHAIFPLVQIAAATCILAGNYRDRIGPTSLAYRLLLLILVVEMTYKEVHENHLIWFVPLAALHLGANRHGLLPGLLRAARSFGGAPPSIGQDGGPSL